MEVRELTFKGESDPKLYACGKCGKAYSPKIYGGREEVVHAAARRAAACGRATLGRAAAGSATTTAGGTLPLGERAGVVDQDAPVDGGEQPAAYPALEVVALRA